MLKDLFILRRLLYSLISVVIAALITGIKIQADWAEMFLFVFFLSLFWQYIFLHFLLKYMTVGQREVTLIIWLLLASANLGWWAVELWKFDYLQDWRVERVVHGFFWTLTHYELAAQMLIAGICASSLAKKRGWINRPLSTENR